MTFAQRGSLSGKSYQIKVNPLLIDKLDMCGKIITANAMAMQKTEEQKNRRHRRTEEQRDRSTVRKNKLPE